jgi:dipeptidyl aminopeptidase/acylaminoacyl peptidase
MIATTALIAAAAGAIALTAYGAVCSAVAHRFTTPRRHSAGRPDGLSAAPVNFVSRDGRARIDAWYLQAAPARGAVIFVHGLNGCRGGELKSPTFDLARQLVASGLSVLMIDLRGHGTSSAARMTYGRLERFDVLGAVDWLRAQGYRPAGIGVLGASMGAATALLAAADEPAIGAVFADSPFADFEQMIERQFRKLSGLPKIVLPGTLAICRLLTGVDLRRVRPIAHAAALVGRPVMVVHSEGDRFINVEDSHAIAAECGAELWTTPNGGHVGSYRAAPIGYSTRVVAFFTEALLGHPVANRPHVVVGLAAAEPALA